MLNFAKGTDDKAVSYLALKEQFNWDYDAVKSAGSLLVENGLAEEKYHRPVPGQQVLWGIVLTEKGRNSKKFFWAAVCSFLLKSVAVPIAVSFATSVLTTLAIQQLQH